MKFSVIITLYNKAPYIARTLRSVIRQSKAAAQIVIVDDVSTDNSLQVVRQTLEAEADWLQHTEVNIIEREHNGGPGAARNTAIKEVTGDYVFLLDGDDEYKPGVFERAESVFSKYDPAIFFLQFEQDPNGRQLPNIAGLSEVTEELEPDVLGIPNLIAAFGHDNFGMMGSTVGCKRMVLDHGFYEENLNCFEGLEFWYRAARYMEKFSGTALLLAGVSVTFHLTQNSVSRKKVADGGEIYLPLQFKQFRHSQDRDVQKLRKRIFTIWMRNAQLKAPNWQQKLWFYWQYRRPIVSNLWLNFRFGMR